MIWIDIDGPKPKRGDLIQTNVGDRRERTWFILHARRIVRRDKTAKPRYSLQMVRWWEIDPETRMRLYRSAERNGGQRLIHFHRYPAKKKHKTFEEYMRCV